MSPQRRYGLKKRIGFGVAGILGLLALARWGALSSLFSANYLPHGYWYLAKPALIWTNALADGLIAVSYALLFGCLFWLAGKVRRIAVLHQYLWILIGFGLFILACDLTHGMGDSYDMAAGLSACSCIQSSVRSRIVSGSGSVRQGGPGVYQEHPAPVRSSGLEHSERPKTKQPITGDRSRPSNQSQMMIEFRMDGTIIKANSNYLRTFGYQDAELTDRHHSALRHEGIQAKHRVQEVLGGTESRPLPGRAILSYCQAG